MECHVQQKKWEMQEKNKKKNGGRQQLATTGTAIWPTSQHQHLPFG